MKLVDCTIRYAIPALGIATRWLKEELNARSVKVLLSEACLAEFVADAGSAARREAASANIPGPYASCLRLQIAARAEFVRLWTQSDDGVDMNDPFGEQLVRIARKFALPRPWRLSEPVASECPRPTPTYLHWASAS